VLLEEEAEASQPGVVPGGTLIVTRTSAAAPASVKPVGLKVPVAGRVRGRLRG